MIQEFLVILACAQNQGCSPTSSAYYSTNPAFQRNVRHQANVIKEAAGPTVVALSPLIIFPVKKQAAIPLTKYFSLVVSERGGSSVMIRFSF